MGTQRIRQPFMKVSSFFCQFYYELVNTLRFNEEKSYCMSVLILMLMFLGKILKHHFLKAGGDGGPGGRGAGGPGGRGLCKSIVAQRGGQH